MQKNNLRCNDKNDAGKIKLHKRLENVHCDPLEIISLCILLYIYYGKLHIRLRYGRDSAGNYLAALTFNWVVKETIRRAVKSPASARRSRRLRVPPRNEFQDVYIVYIIVIVILRYLRHENIEREEDDILSLVLI